MPPARQLCIDLINRSMSTPLGRQFLKSDNSCNIFHRMRSFLHKEVATTELLGGRLIELLSQNARLSSQNLHLYESASWLAHFAFREW